MCRTPSIKVKVIDPPRPGRRPALRKCAPHNVTLGESPIVNVAPPVMDSFVSGHSNPPSHSGQLTPSGYENKRGSDVLGVDSQMVKRPRLSYSLLIICY